jgi:hypothetical protein
METNKKLDSVLDECLERVVFHGESIEDVLKRHPADAEELKPLLSTALVLKQAVAVSPSPEFRARARYQFRQALGRQETLKHGFSLNFLPRWSMALALFMAVLITSGGVVAAASNSMPDSLLYPVKIATEQVQSTITFSVEARAELYAALVDKRVGEIVYLSEKGDIEKIGVLSRNLNDNVDRLDALVMLAYGNNSLPKFALSAPAGNAAFQPGIEPNSVVPKAPVPATGNPLSGGGQGPGGEGSETGGKNVAPSASGGIAEPLASPALPPAPLAAAPPAPAQPPGVNDLARTEKADNPGDSSNKLAREQKLLTILSAYAIKHPAQLRDALDHAPEAARPDILRAIARTAAGYEKALRSIELP